METDRDVERPPDPDRVVTTGREGAPRSKRLDSRDEAPRGNGGDQRDARLPPVRADSDVSSLTAREREVLGLLAQGLPTVAVAERLGISRVTVRNHVQRILGKLSAHTRLQALAAAYRLGLLEPPGFPKVQ
jgi:DNA-binding CsgD family transcriptional regulator